MLARRTHTFAPLLQLSDNLDRLFNRFGDGELESLFPESPNDAAWMPAVDVVDAEKDIIVRAEVPGVSPKDIEVTVTGRVLTIAGEKQAASEKSEGGVHFAERRFGTFRRMITLPTTVDTESITASHKDGVLEVRLSKSESVLPKRIPVKAEKN